MLLNLHTVKFNEEEEKSIKLSRVGIISKLVQKHLLSINASNIKNIYIFMTDILLPNIVRIFFTIDMISNSIKMPSKQQMNCKNL